MREIKFRAWDECRKKMFYSLFEWDDNYSESFQFINGVLKAFVTHDPNPHVAGNGEEIVTYECPVMEFSGLLDKHGVEIYEGDIYKDADFSYIIDFGEYEFEGDVWFGMHSRCISDTYNHCGPLCKEDNHVIEVVGNRFQHPELLNEK